MMRLERKLVAPRGAVFRAMLAAVVLALVVISLILWISGHSVTEISRQVFAAAFTRPGALSGTLLSATPLIFTGLCAAVAFRMKVWNIGGEGQLYMGAVGAAGVGIAVGADLSRPLAILAMILGGIVVAGFWALIPALLKMKLRTNEILTSLMMNFIAGFFMLYLIFGSRSYWRDTVTPTGRIYPQGMTVGENGFWPALEFGSTSIPFGFILGVIFAAGLLVVLRSTTFGFKLRVMADSPDAGRYAGINRTAMVIGVMVVAGALAGIGGASLVGDFAHRLEPNALQQMAYGYTGIVVAALARYNPIGVVVGAILLGALTNAGFTLQGPEFPLGLIGTIQGVLLFCVLGSEVFIKYRLRRDQAPKESRGSSAPVKNGLTEKDLPEAVYRDESLITANISKERE